MPHQKRGGHGVGVVEGLHRNAGPQALWLPTATIQDEWLHLVFNFNHPMADLYYGPVDDYMAAPAGPQSDDDESQQEEARDFARQFEQTVNAVRSDTSLYEGSTRPAMVTALELLALLGKNSATAVMADELFKFIAEILPVGNRFPESIALAKSTMKALGLGYTVFDACPCDEHLYHTKGQRVCPHCNLSRYETYEDRNGETVVTTRPHRQVRKFSLKDYIRAGYRVPAMSEAFRHAGTTRSQEPDHPDKKIHGIKGQ